MEHDGGVAPGPVAQRDRVAKEAFHRPRVAGVPILPEHRERQHLRVRGEHVRRRIGGCVVSHEEVILAGRGGEDLADLPEQKTDGLGLVTAGNAYVKHCSSMG